MEILLNPGPVNLSERVRKSLLKPDLCHREKEFTLLQERIRKQILDVYQLPADIWTAVLITGSGSAAMEAMMCSMIPATGKVLILENGVYGERLSRIAGIHGIEFDVIHQDWGAEISPQAIGDHLAGGYSHLALVHHETTTGRLNDISALSDICRDLNIPVLLDAVSSFGAEEICFRKWGLDACAATANKCLHGIPGTSFVICQRKSLLAVDIHRTLYLDLLNYMKQQDTGGTPFTQSVQSFYALDEALQEFHEAGGWQARRDVYRQRMQKVVQGLVDMGVSQFLDPGVSSCVLNSFNLPTGLTYDELHDGLKEKGFVIYAGQGGLAKSIFRISLMGDIKDADIDRFLAAFAGLV